MTVSELIKELEKLNPDLFIIATCEDEEILEPEQAARVLGPVSVSSEFVEIYRDNKGRTRITPQTIGEAQEVAFLKMTINV
ncbi:hypothetical protein ACFQDN_24665 [Pseudomonas asuensis]|uniref:Uncharacterized protein n=1 Tax=Pseudomonas asuensis TaxID=1825787 RepID=A0ABQ2GY11_9PSED|nr:hypothetical protein [Pseudomonas asuensis]GGM19180.1 hypothetical protein GCM10009425_32580 [Pseudomonas asuensis]